MVPAIIAAAGGAGALAQYQQNRKSGMKSTMTGQQRGWMKTAGDSWQNDLSGKPDIRGLARLKNENIVNPGWQEFQEQTAPRLQKQMGQNFFGNARQEIMKKAITDQQNALDQQTAEMIFNENQDARLRQAQARQGLQGLVDINSLAYQNQPSMMDKAGQLMGFGAAASSAMNSRNRNMGYVPPAQTLPPVQ